MISVKLVDDFTVQVTGIKVDEFATKADWRAAARKMAKSLQERVAISFAKERVAGTSSLLKNTPEYDKRKAAEGYDTRRGHRTNYLQSVLDSKELFRVSAVGKGGQLKITMMESLLYGHVEYAEFYEDKKVQRDGILSLAASWVEQDAVYLRELAAEQAMKEARAKERQRIMVAKAADSAAKKLAAAAAAKPKVIAGYKGNPFKGLKIPKTGFTNKQLKGYAYRAARKLG